MSNYTKATNFATKDTLPVGDTNKKVKGTEIDDEFNSIATAVNSKADTNSPALTGVPTAPTATTATNTTQVATTAFVQAQKASMALTGTPTAPTATTGTDTTQIATTEFVQQEITANAYTLPAATSSTLGGVKVSLSGSTLTISTT
jgi:hypothetical protein